MDAPSSEMPLVQRVARVLAGPTPQEWPRHIETARTIILAMRGPTSAMLEAVHPGLPFYDDELADDWNAMLTQAAGECGLTPAKRQVNHVAQLMHA